MLNKTLDDNDYGKRDKKGYWLPFEKVGANPKYLVPLRTATYTRSSGRFCKRIR